MGNKNICHISNEMKIYSNGELVHTIKDYSGQHYYPHKLSDYAKAIYKYVSGVSSHLPIMAVDCHDCYACDFKCQDCLADETKEWFRKSLNTFANYKDEFVKYKQALKKIAEYSAEVGETSVRFEMSGEGNPDLYPYRSEIIEFAHSLGMKPVYISSGSYINETLCEVLVRYCSYIRISLPGITNASYKKYSGQDKFLFSNAIDLIRQLVTLRKEFNRENELLIGVRTCLRPAIAHAIAEVSTLLIDDIGIDTFQIVRAIKNNNSNDDEMVIPEEIRNLLQNLGNNKKISVPDCLDTYYNFRETTDTFRGSMCMASELTPILYSNYLLPCTHTQMIKKVQSVGVDLAEKEIMPNHRDAKACDTCCAIKDNSIFADIFRIVKRAVQENHTIDFVD